MAFEFPLRWQAVPRESQPEAAQAVGPEASLTRGQAGRIGWARLLARVFGIDVEHCPNGGGDSKLVAAILERAVMETILTHLGLQARARDARSSSRARGQPMFGRR